MNMGKPGGSEEPQLMLDINTTPLIDVMLVLLIMLIITIPIQLHAVNLNMPVGTPPPAEVQPEVVKIDIDENSIIHWQGLPLADAAELEEKMRAVAAAPLPPEIHLRPHKAARYAVVAHVLASTRRLGLNRIGVVGSEQFLE